MTVETSLEEPVTDNFEVITDREVATEEDVSVGIEVPLNDQILPARDQIAGEYVRPALAVDGLREVLVEVLELG